MVQDYMNANEEEAKGMTKGTDTTKMMDCMRACIGLQLNDECAVGVSVMMANVTK
jgi:hypothetical protein